MPRVPPVVAVVYEAIFGVTQRFWAVVDKQVHTGLGNTMVSLRLSIGLRVKKRSRDVLHRPQLQELLQGFCQKAGPLLVSSAGPDSTGMVGCPVNSSACWATSMMSPSPHAGLHFPLGIIRE